MRILRIRGALKEKEDIAVMTAEFDGSLTLLFHMEPEYGKAEMQAIAAEILDSLHSLVECRIMLGGIYDSMSNIIITSFHQAQMVAEFCENDRGRVFFYDRNNGGKAGERRLCKRDAGVRDGHAGGEAKGGRPAAGSSFNQYIGTDRNVYTSRAKKYAAINPILMALENHAGSCTEYRWRNTPGIYLKQRDGQKLLKLLHEPFLAI